MSNKPQHSSENIQELAQFLRDEFKDHDNKVNIDTILLFAYNGIGKTRLSMEFKDQGKKNNGIDTLYFNAFTEDLFTWDNDLENDIERKLKFNSISNFFGGIEGYEMEKRIRKYLDRYINIDFRIDYDNQVSLAH